MDSRALTRVQAAVLIGVIAVAAVAGSIAYVLFNPSSPAAKPIVIGISADLDTNLGEGIWRAAILAAEQINAEGGILGRNFTIVAEDDDSMSPSIDVAVISNAMTRLITVDKADFVITNVATPEAFFAQEGICVQNRKIILTTSAAFEEYTQRVIDDYDTHKYFFKLFASNSTAQAAYFLDDVVTIGKYSGFTKVALLFQEVANPKKIMMTLNATLPKHGFEVVYVNSFPLATIDFTSYLAAIDESGAQILVTFIGTRATVAFAKEYHDRESPFVTLGFISGATDPEFWSATEGKCENMLVTSSPFIAGFDLTNKSVSTRETYLKRWGTTIPTGFAAATYDGIRFVLPDALERAGTTETEAVIKALETTDLETTLARHFVYTQAHDILITSAGSANPPEMYQIIGLSQIQANQTFVTVVPESFMKEAGATFKYPPWQGPWSR